LKGFFMIFKFLEGIANNIVRFGLAGFAMKNNAGICEFRNAVDSAFEIVRCKSPIGNDDAATKGYVDPLLAAMAGMIKSIRVVTGVNAEYDSTNLIPANARVYEVSFEPTVAYSAGTTVSIGQAGSVALVMATTENTPEILGRVVKDSQDIDWGAAPLAVKVTVNGAPAAGAGVAIVKYCVPKG
jgi:hypothetical protein